jgi:pilus assembly protein CpaC
VWTRAGRRQYDVTVTEKNLSDLRRILQASVNDAAVSVTTVDDALVVNGSVQTNQEMLRIGAVLASFEPIAAENKYIVVNAVTVAQPLAPLQSELSADPATAGVRVDPDLKGDLSVSGPVPDRTTAENILSRVRSLAGPYLSADGKVIDRLESATVSQVDVKVYVLEVDDTALRNLGIDLQSATFNTDGTYTLGAAQFPLVEGLLPIGKALNIGGFFRTITLAPTLNLILTSGHAKLLSSPDLLTLPGHEATFLVGGQIPIPVGQGLGAVSITYKDFGVQLKVTPTLLADGAVETLITPVVSNLDFSDGVTLGGYVVPALKTSQLSTDVITKAGESIVLGGLLQRIEQRNINKIPLLGDLPILGPLFRSTSYQLQQSDVVFVMTPTILTR